MQSISVKLKERSYKIEIAAGLLDQAGALARRAVGRNASRAVIISNPTINRLYGSRLARSLGIADFRTHTLVIGEGERYKNLKTAETIYSFLINRRISRSDILVALGGGVVGDIAGFVAATYL